VYPCDVVDGLELPGVDTGLLAEEGAVGSGEKGGGKVEDAMTRWARVGGLNDESRTEM